MALAVETVLLARQLLDLSSEPTHFANVGKVGFVITVMIALAVELSRALPLRDISLDEFKPVLAGGGLDGPVGRNLGHAALRTKVADPTVIIKLGQLTLKGEGAIGELKIRGSAVALEDSLLVVNGEDLSVLPRLRSKEYILFDRHPLEPSLRWTIRLPPPAPKAFQSI